jgi:hypothetical protein
MAAGGVPLGAELAGHQRIEPLRVGIPDRHVGRGEHSGLLPATLTKLDLVGRLGAERPPPRSGCGGEQGLVGLEHVLAHMRGLVGIELVPIGPEHARRSAQVREWTSPRYLRAVGVRRSWFTQIATGKPLTRPWCPPCEQGAVVAVDVAAGAEVVPVAADPAAQGEGGGIRGHVGGGGDFDRVARVRARRCPRGCRFPLRTARPPESTWKTRGSAVREESSTLTRTPNWICQMYSMLPQPSIVKASTCWRWGGAWPTDKDIGKVGARPALEDAAGATVGPVGLGHVANVEAGPA